MRYQFSGRVKVILHLVILGALAMTYARIEEGSPSWVLAVYVCSTLFMWMFSLPGSKRRFINKLWGSQHFIRKLSENGYAHMGHAQRKDWDRYGRQSRVFSHALCLCLVLLLMPHRS